jgi:GNAT superfamily N-acetyltransferase
VERDIMGTASGLVRPARADDADSLGSIHVASWRSVYRGNLSASFLAAMSGTERAVFWTEKIEAGMTVLVFETSGVVEGFCACGPCRDDDGRPEWWEVYNLHVTPRERGKGFGAVLLAAARAAALRAGATVVTLWVVKDNLGARRFYERHGLSPDGASKNQQVAPGEKLDEVRYRGALHVDASQ